MKPNICTQMPGKMEKYAQLCERLNLDFVGVGFGAARWIFDPAMPAWAKWLTVATAVCVTIRIAIPRQKRIAQ